MEYIHSCEGNQNKKPSRMQGRYDIFKESNIVALAKFAGLYKPVHAWNTYIIIVYINIGKYFSIISDI